MTATACAAQRVSVRSLAGFDNAATDTAPTPAVAGSVEPEVQADERMILRVEAALDAFEGRLRRCAFGWRSRSSGQCF